MRKTFKKKRYIKFMVFLIMFSFVTGIGIKGNLAYGVNSKGASNSDSENLLELNKEATAIHTNREDQLKDRSYKIDLSVKAKENVLKDQKPKDVILVLDQSGSMGYPASGYSKRPIDALKSSVNEFSKDLIDASSKNQISIIAFSSGGESRYENKEERRYIESIEYDDNGKISSGYIFFRGGWKKIKIENSYGHIYNENNEEIEKDYVYEDQNGYYVQVRIGNPEDAQLKVDFTNDFNKIEKQVNSILEGASTDTESALLKVKSQLENEKIKNDGREKYVIFFTDGLPNVLVGDYITNIIENTIKTYKNIENSNKDVHFISLGFRSMDSEGSIESKKFLKQIQNYNNQIDPGCNGVIYMEDPDDIKIIYDKIANKITSVADDATITDIVPEGFEIIKDSESPKGAIIEGNKISWNGQSIGKGENHYTFKIKAKDSNFGTENIISGNENTLGENMNTNSKATVNYTYNLDNSKRTEEFKVPNVTVPNKGELHLIGDKTYYYGDKIKLKDLISDLNIKYGPEEGYTYIWSDDKGHSITLNNQKKNSKIGNTFDEKSSDNDSITLKEDTKFTLEIKKDSTYDGNKSVKLDLKDSVNIKVINPQVTINKEVKGEKNCKNVFSFKIEGNNNTWYGEVKEKEPFVIRGLKKGKYSIRELTSQGYKLDSVEINGKSIDKDNPVFTIDDNNNNITINVTNEKLPETNYFNKTEIKENEFSKDTD